MSLALASIAYRAGIVKVQPIFLVAEATLPALIGLFLFQERKGFDLPEWFYLGLGFIGALLIGLNL